MLTVMVKVLCVVLTSGTPIQVMPDGPVADGFYAMDEPSSPEELAPFTLLSFGSPEELEACLTGGYPTPEIRAVLEDESIPEEDRYWLDCRLRSLIAQMLHRFYDRDGNIIEVDAEWISPGEKYWQETMILQPPIVREEPPPPSPNASGYRVLSRDSAPASLLIPDNVLYNLYGERIGQLARSVERASSSRDASITVKRTGAGRNYMNPGGALFFSFLYPDGSQIEVNVLERYPWAFNHYNDVVSQDGSISAWNIFSVDETERSYILVYDKDGNEIESYEMPPSFDILLDGISISGDNNTVACAGGSNGSVLINRITGEIYWFHEPTGRPPVFSENSRFCVIGGFSLSHSIRVIDINKSSYFSIPTDEFIPGTAISNDGAVIVAGGYVYLNGVNVLSLKQYGHPSLSPNGFFYIGSTHSTPLGMNALHILLNLHSLIEGVEQ